MATSSPKTMEISAVADASGKNLGKEAKAEAPAAKSRFFLTLSRPVPGRTGDQATDSSPGSVKLDVSSSKALGNKDPSEPMALPVAAASGRDPDKTPGQTPAQREGLSAPWGPAPSPPEAGGAAPSKPKDSGFFDKLFKLDKGREKAPGAGQQEARSAEHHDQAVESPASSPQADDVPAETVSAERDDPLAPNASLGGAGRGGGGKVIAPVLLCHHRGILTRYEALDPSRTNSTLQRRDCPCCVGRNICWENNNSCGIWLMSKKQGGGLDTDEFVLPFIKGRGGQVARVIHGVCRERL